MHLAPTPRALAPRRGRARSALWARWAASLLLLGGVVLVVGHRAEPRQIARLLAEAQLGWLAVAVPLQALTYVCAAEIWRRVLQRAGSPLPLARLLPLGLAKLFTDQALPSIGISGNLLVVRSLQRRGVRREVTLGVLLVGIIAYDLGYLTAIALALGVLWLHGDVSTPQWVLAGVLSALVAVFPLTVILLRGRLDRLARLLRRVPVARQLTRALAQAPPELLRNPALLAQTGALQLAVFCLDAATLGTMLRALGVAAPLPIVFASFVTASVAASVALVPGGLGVFEGAAIGALHLLGVPIEAALAATLLLRASTFWVPMAPGLWLARRETRAVASPPKLPGT